MVGAVQVTEAVVRRRWPVPEGRGPGGPTVIELDGAEAGLVPLAFLAVTVNV